MASHELRRMSYAGGRRHFDYTPLTLEGSGYAKKSYVSGGQSLAELLPVPTKAEAPKKVVEEFKEVIDLSSPEVKKRRKAPQSPWMESHRKDLMPVPQEVKRKQKKVQYGEQEMPQF